MLKKALILAGLFLPLSVNATIHNLEVSVSLISALSHLISPAYYSGEGTAIYDDENYILSFTITESTDGENLKGSADLTYIINLLDSTAIYRVENCIETYPLYSGLFCGGTPFETSIILTENDLSMFNGSGSFLIDTGFTIKSYDLTISTIPIPTAAWFFGSALIGLVGVKRKK